MPRLFSTGNSNPLGPLVHKTSDFVARVKKGMHEKEAELQSRYLNGPAPAPSVQTKSDPQPQKIVESSRGQVNAEPEGAERLRHRIERDRALGDDFFSSGVSPKI